MPHKTGIGLLVLFAMLAADAATSGAAFAKTCGAKPHPPKDKHCSWVCVAEPFKAPRPFKHWVWEQICAYGPSNPSVRGR